eukprot:CAMPEP_0183340528 /NCGR_PEP_ID=MMETSP0164_2-20130417/7052_1 /TAXON_ID=221442 /ORGANISM="Coccolithus pelagicus ssp braarudi, Strain PLY182g" /LENGTH=36 /DNA_ID= /DNA_START= /DNA_END= /DNA_ORIENTATION=
MWKLVEVTTRVLGTIWWYSAQKITGGSEGGSDDEGG